MMKKVGKKLYNCGIVVSRQIDTYPHAKVLLHEQAHVLG